jgi:hypothetical protein
MSSRDALVYSSVFAKRSYCQKTYNYIKLAKKQIKEGKREDNRGETHIKKDNREKANISQQ